METLILNKHCFIKKDNSLYCSKCGKKQLQDTYNMKRHMTECKFKSYDFLQIFEDDNNYSYAFLEEKDRRTGFRSPGPRRSGSPPRGPSP